MSDPTISVSNSLACAIDALQADIDRGVVVVDGRGHVVGILTEGDIIRAIRRGTLTEALVENVMTVNVRVTTGPMTDEDLVREFAARGTLLIPVVDEARRLLYVQRTREAVGRLLIKI